MKILVTGGTGFLGGHLVPQLIADGHEVLTLIRSPRDAARMQAMGATTVLGDLSKRAGAALPMIDEVVHAAAWFHFSGPRKPYLEVNVEGTRRLLAAAAAAGATVFVTISSGGVIMDDAGSPVIDADEGVKTYPDSFSGYIASKAQAETLVLSANRPGFRTLALRPTAIWGPGDAFAKALPEAIAGGRFALIDRGDYPYATTHVDNVVEAVKLALSTDAGGRAYFIADREVMTFREFIGLIAETHGETIAGLRSIPYRLASLIGRSMDLVWGLMRRDDDPPLSRTMVRMIGRAYTVNDSAARRELGYVGQVDLAAGRQTYLDAVGAKARTKNAS